ncbi:hypothetical protein H5410_036593 [Solanum commersonii]|uniref:Uncharacterized protein n=1 Tax=Solanum commersonii TaxID=4109 RepID=A0A9J5Y4Q3_SOLCO|nr:hypothetical protein H5410_036593 [Solanum commersonii]
MDSAGEKLDPYLGRGNPDRDEPATGACGHGVVIPVSHVVCNENQHHGGENRHNSGGVRHSSGGVQYISAIDEKKDESKSSTSLHKLTVSSLYSY